MPPRVSSRRLSSSISQAQLDEKAEEAQAVPNPIRLIDGPSRLSLINEFQRQVNEARKSAALGSKNFPAYDKKNYQTPLGFLNEYRTFMSNQVGDPRIWSLLLPDFIAPALQSPGAQSIRSSLEIHKLAVITEWDEVQDIWVKTQELFLVQFSTYQDRYRGIGELWGLCQKSGESVQEYGHRWIHRWSELKLDPELPSHKLFFVVSLLPILRERLLRDQELKAFIIETSRMEEIIHRANSYSSDEPSLVSALSGFKRSRTTPVDLGLHCDYCSPGLKNHLTKDCRRKNAHSTGKKLRSSDFHPRSSRFTSSGHAGQPPAVATAQPHPAPPIRNSFAGTKPTVDPRKSGTKADPTQQSFVCRRCDAPAPGHWPNDCPNPKRP